jgi:calcium/calmodulin-dependent protein kinase-4
MGLTRKGKKGVLIEKSYLLDAAELGRGQFATVHSAQPKDVRTVTVAGTTMTVPPKVAVKVIDRKAAAAAGDIDQEISIMRALSHAHILQLFEGFTTPKRTHLARSYYREQKAAAVIEQLASALAYMHGKGIVHRDVKPENVLYLDNCEDSPIKLADFGASAIVGGGGAHDDIGTPGYVAPEVLNRQGMSDQPCLDMWSIGVLLYILLCGFPPFYAEDMEELFASIRGAKYDFPSDSAWVHVSLSGRNLVRQLLTLDTRARLSATALQAHAWVGDARAGRFAAGPPPNPGQLKSKGLKLIRKAALGIIAQRRMLNAIGGPHADRARLPPGGSAVEALEGSALGSTQPAVASAQQQKAGAPLLSQGADTGLAQADSFLKRLEKAETRDASHIPRRFQADRPPADTVSTTADLPMSGPPASLPVM